MDLGTYIQTYNVNTLLGIEAESEEFKKDIQDTISKESLTRALENLIKNNINFKTYIDKNGFDKIDQEDLLSEYPEITQVILFEVIKLKIEMLMAIVSDFKLRVEEDKQIQEDDREYFLSIIFDLEKTLAKDIEMDLKNADIENFKLFYQKAKQLNFIKE